MVQPNNDLRADNNRFKKRYQTDSLCLRNSFDHSLKYRTTDYANYLLMSGYYTNGGLFYQRLLSRVI